MISSSVQVEGGYHDLQSVYRYSDNDLEELQGLVDLELIVYDSETGRVLPNALISLDAIGRTAMCNDQGRAVLRQIPTGEYIIDVIKCGYVANSTLLTLRPKTPSQLSVRMVGNG